MVPISAKLRAPNNDKTPQPAHTIKVNPIEPARRRTPLGDTKMPEPSEQPRRSEKMLAFHENNFERPNYDTAPKNCNSEAKTATGTRILVQAGFCRNYTQTERNSPIMVPTIKETPLISPRFRFRRVDSPRGSFSVGPEGRPEVDIFSSLAFGAFS